MTGRSISMPRWTPKPRIKHISSPVAGLADVLIVPNIEAVLASAAPPKAAATSQRVGCPKKIGSFTFDARVINEQKDDCLGTSCRGSSHKMRITAHAM